MSKVDPMVTAGRPAEAQPAGHGKRAAVDPVVKRSRLASVPLLRIFVPPSGAAAAVDVDGRPSGTAEAAAGTARPVEVAPYALPGSPLRMSSGAASRGWYGPHLPGAPSTTRQAEILNTAIIGAPTSFQGVINGRDYLSSTAISHDAATAYNMSPRRLTSPNVLILGTVGAGKSSFTKTVLVMRPLLLRRHRAVVFDKKDQGGVGEYTALNQRMGGTHLFFSADGGGTRLNLLDPHILTGTGLRGQGALINAIARIVRDDTPSTVWERKATRYALKLAFESFQDGRVPTPSDLLPFLGRVPSDAGLSKKARDRFHQAGLTIQYALDDLLEGFSGTFDGETSPDVDLEQKLTVFDVSQLPEDGPAVPTVMAIGNMWLMGRLRAERNYITSVVYEEGWHMIGGPSAQLVKSNQKLSRGLGISNVFVMHKGTDIPADSPGYTVVQEAQTVYAFRQDRVDDAAWVTDTFNFAPDTTQTLMGLGNGACVFKYGSNPETHLKHIRSDWEIQVTNTDEAMEAGAARA